MTIYKLLDDIFNKMNTTSNQSAGQWQRRFIEVLFQTILACAVGLISPIWPATAR